jgi:predicted phage terminase large subunit-like protein
MYLLHVFRQRLEYPKLKLHIKSLAKRWDADQILIEDKGAGTSLIQDLRNSTSLSITHFVPKEDKVTRMMAVSPLIESAQVFIPKEAPWLATFQHEIANFPYGKHDDQVDSMSQFLSWARTRYKHSGKFEIIVGPPLESSLYDF